VQTSKTAGVEAGKMMWCKKFIFIHIPRTGGDSLTEAFGGIPYISKDVYKFKHCLARKGRYNLFSSVWFDAFKFTIVRPPLDLMRSWFNHARTYQQHGDKENATHYWLQFCEYVSRVSFPDFVEREIVNVRNGGHYARYANIDGVKPLTLQQAYSKLCELTGETPELKHLNASENHIEHPYPELKREIEKVCWRDVEIWKKITAKN